MLPQKIAFVDIETTGCRLSDRIIEIGILRVESKGPGSSEYKLVEKFETLLNPGCYIPEEITMLTGISASQLENAPSFSSVKQDIYRLLSDCTFVAHNVRFDYGFVKNEFKREEITFRSKQICTVKLSRTLFPDLVHHNLDALMQRHNIKCKRRHRAFDDASVLWKFFQKMLKEIPHEIMLAALDKVAKKPTVPINIDPVVLEDLPETPGVYIFYGKSGMPLYVGKSINLRDRILSHFSSDYLTPTDMKLSQQIESIETITTAGELGALLKEAAMVKKLQPLYNRKLRNARKMLVLKAAVDKSGYSMVDADETGIIGLDELDRIVGVFRNRKSSKEFLAYLAKEFNLCGKLLGTESGLGECFGFRLGTCGGACAGKEKPVKYNMRFAQAFAKTKLRPWPFEKPVLITEDTDGFIVDKWCYLGSVSKERYEEKSRDTSVEPIFDLDTYKILVNYLSSPKNLKNIRKLASSPYLSLT